MAVNNDTLAQYSERGFNVKLAQLANAYMVSVNGPNRNIVNSHSDKKRAEIDYSFFVHHIQMNNL
jgi:hypothetical protein